MRSRLPEELLCSGGERDFQAPAKPIGPAFWLAELGTLVRPWSGNAVGAALLSARDPWAIERKASR